MEKANHRDVGFKAEALDNSHTMNLCTFQEYGVADREVQIISRPFKLRIISNNKMIEREFIIVKYENQIVRILNTFKLIHRK